MKIIVSMLIAIIVLASIAFADNDNEAITQADSTKQGKIKAKSKTASEFSEEYSKKNKLNSIPGKNRHQMKRIIKLNQGITATEPLEICYQYFEFRKIKRGYSNPRMEFKVRRIRNNEKGTKIDFYQVHNDVRVKGYRYGFLISNDGWILSGGGRYAPEARFVDTNPSINEDEIKHIAINDPHAKGTRLEHVLKTELVIDCEEDCRLVWIVTIDNMEDSSVKSFEKIVAADLYFDANTGKFIKKYTNIIGPCFPDIFNNKNNKKDDKNDHQDK
ncbi:MAG: hypothetical protein J7K40_14610 [candidate division Zixibacteria bacterium]|nr:hypothetical protein [candidate division Zixibacteria bacterium]